MSDTNLVSYIQYLPHWQEVVHTRSGTDCLVRRYLAADMQLYAVCLALTLALWRWRRAAVAVLTALLVGSVALLFGLAYYWNLVPTYVMHRPE